MKNLVLRKGLVVFGLILAFVFSLFAVVYGAQSEGGNINNDSNRQQQLQNNEQKPISPNADNGETNEISELSAYENTDEEPCVDITVEDTIDSSENQQKWLAYPNSNLIINPNSDADASSAELIVGIKNESGEIATVLDNVFNIYEANASKLSTGDGTLFYTADFSAATGRYNNMYTEESRNCLSRNDSVADALDITVRETAITERQYASLEITDNSAAGLAWDFREKNYIAVIDVAEVAENGTVVLGATSNPALYISDIYTITEPGRYVLLLNEDVMTDSGNVIEDHSYLCPRFRFTAAGDYKFNEFKIYEVDKGATLPVSSSSTFSIASLTNALSFDNGSSAEVSDYFANESVITRRISITEEGKYVIWGKVIGDAVYKDYAKAIVGTIGNYNYAFKPSVKGKMYFYNSVEDLTSGTNALASIDGAAYWALETNELVTGTNVYLGFCVSDKYSADEVYQQALTAASIPYSNDTFSNLEDFWNSYISENNVDNFLENIDLGHVWTSPVWTWADDFSSASVIFTCGNDSSHTTELTAVVSSEESKAATCTENGEILYTASVVLDGETYTDTKTSVIPSTGHTFNTEWSSDETNHWHNCVNCDARADEAEHTFEWVIDKEATENESGSQHEECSVCGYSKDAVEIPAGGGATDDPSGNPDDTGDNGYMVLWISLVVIAGVALIGITTFYIVRKRTVNK